MSDLDTIITAHRNIASGDGWSCAMGCWTDSEQPCLAHRLAVRARDAEAEVMVQSERARDAEQKVAAVRSVHARYFDLDEHPGGGDSCPEPEDVWRFDRDFRGAMGGDHDQPECTCGYGGFHEPNNPKCAQYLGGDHD